MKIKKLFKCVSKITLIFSVFVYNTFASDIKVSVSGIYPHLAMWNSEGECGTGAVVPFAGKLWAVTYGPHVVFESDDKLYEISPDLKQTIRKESLGGTHANRMIHEPSNQLFIGCYAIDKNGNVRAIDRNAMAGRLTGNARSLTDHKNKIYFATMEEALYEVDVNTLEVVEIIRDGNLKPHASPDKPQISKLHGYHGKGFYSGFGQLFYSNNGIHHKNVAKDPTLKSGALALWNLGDKDWSPIRVCQFTEITSKYGITGSDNTNTPIWALGFDAKSVILMLREETGWINLRLPKASHSYDGSHGWNTEWPRIRDIGESKYLMTMHGAFWDFPPNFSTDNSRGIKMKSNYLKVVGDFCEWNGKIVLGCDDSAQKEFLNTRAMKSKNCAPEKSNSNFVFLNADELNKFGPNIGRGSVFLREDVKAGTISEPMFIGGFKFRVLSLSTDSKTPVEVRVIMSKNFADEGKSFVKKVSSNSPLFIPLPLDNSEWLKVKVENDAQNFTAHINLSNVDSRSIGASDIFNSIARIEDGAKTVALMRSAKNKNLGLVAFEKKSNDNIEEIGTYELNEKLELKKEKLEEKLEKSIRNSMITPEGVSIDKRSVLIEEDGKRYRLPLNARFGLKNKFGYPRLAREVATERDLLNVGGTFYELPARNAQGMAKIRPIASHNFDIFDFASYRGLMLISGMNIAQKTDLSKHTIVSDDGKLALWAGSIDDLWKLGKPVGEGCVWLNDKVKAGELSDPFLMTAYDTKTIRAISGESISIDVEVDVDGTGLWKKFTTLSLEANKPLEILMPKHFVGYWVRFKARGESKNLTINILYQ